MTMGETILAHELSGSGYPVYSASVGEEPWGRSDHMRRLHPQGTLVVSARGTIGSPRLPQDAPFANTQTTIAVRPRAGTDPTFLRYALSIQDWGAVTEGMGIPMLSVGMLAHVRVPIPPHRSQRAIAEYLDRETAQIDAFIAKSEELIDLLRDRRRSFIARIVTRGQVDDVTLKASGVSWLGMIPAHWDIVRARYLCTVGTGSGDTVDAVDDGEYPFYVRSDTPERSNQFDFDTEAVLTSGDGAGVGKVFHLTSGKFAAHQRVYVLRNFRSVTARFFYLYFSAYFGVVALDGSAKSTVDSVRRHMITDMPIAVPPVDEQEAIVEALARGTRDIDRALDAAQRSVDLARERRAALISAAVTGKIDVGVAV